MQLLVLGMHRSGTSAVARLLNMMGAYFAPEDMALPTTHANLKGHWERQDLADLHEEMLNALGFSWHNLAGFSANAMREEKLEAFLPRLQHILSNLDAHRPWMAKDPRFCLFLPLWQRYLEVPVYLYVYRHPLEIARSLHTREVRLASLTGMALHQLHAANLPSAAVNFPLSLGVALWEKYILQALQDAAPEAPRILVSYPELMAHPLETVKTLYEDLQAYEVQGLRQPSEREIRAHLETKLYREKHQELEANQYLNQQQQALVEALEKRQWEQLATFSKLSGSAAEALQNHQERLYSATRLQASQTAYQATQQQQHNLQQQLQTQTQQAIEQQHHLQQQLQTQTQQAIEQQAEQQQAFNILSEKAQATEQKRQRQQAYLQAALLQLAEKDTELHALQAEQNNHPQALADKERHIQNLSQSINELSQALGSTQQQRNQLWHYLHALETDISAVFNSLTWRSGSLFTRLVLALLLRKPSPTAQDHIQEIRQQLAQLRGQSEASANTSSTAPVTITQALQTAGYAPTDYSAWGQQYDTLSSAQRRDLVHWLRGQKNLPLISILMPTYNTPEKYLRAAIASVQKQLYPNWQLCIADDASTEPKIRKLLETYEKNDGRIKVCFRAQNGHISAATNTALELAEGDWIGFLDHDDELAETALFWVYRALLDAPDAHLFYSDEDKITTEGERHAPHFKPAWNPDLFLSYNYLNHFSVYRATLLRELNGLREGFEGAQDYDLALRVTERLQPEHICHIPRILYHWRVTETSTAGRETQKPYALLAAQKAIAEHFARCQIRARVSDAPELLGANRVTYEIPEPAPLVSIIIPTYNGLALMRLCINSIRSKTRYANYEILIVDNNSDDPAALLYFDELQEKGWARLLKYPQPFNFAAINNMAVAHANGELLCLLNNDIEVISPDWLTEMVGHALRPEIGAVGARLWYPNQTLQHGGIIVGLGGVAGHSHKYFPLGDHGYMGRILVTQNLSAVTAACLLLRKATYVAVDGMNTEHLKVAFNDVDFCLRIGELGLRILWTPYADLYHHESLSRGQEDTPEKIKRFQGEITYMKMRWQAELQNDPAYSPNLSLDTENFAYAWPPRVANYAQALAGQAIIRRGHAISLAPPALRVQPLPVATQPEATAHINEVSDLSQAEAKTPEPVVATAETTAPTTPYALAYQKLQGRGIQIRPFTQPAAVPAQCALEYVDACSAEYSAQVFPELPAGCLTPIQQMCNLDQQDLPYSELDFIICHDELTRLVNPILALQRLFAALKTGGHLLISVPDKRYNYNRYRPLSAFAALQQAYAAGTTQANDSAYEDFLCYAHPHLLPVEMAKPLRHARQRREHIQVWDAPSFSAFMQESLALLGLSARLIFSAQPPEIWEIFQVFEKR